MTDDEKAYWQEWLEDKKGIMFKIEWFRIILDEAQYVHIMNVSDVQLYQKSSGSHFSSLRNFVIWP